MKFSHKMPIIPSCAAVCAYFKNPTRYSDKLFQNLKKGAVSRDQFFSVHCKIYDVKLQKTVIIQTALGVVYIMKHRNFT